MRTFFTAIHEYIHYLARGSVNNSGFAVSSKDVDVYTIINEGVTDLLSCYFVEYILRETNKCDLDFILSDSPFKLVTSDDYDIVINPFLKSLNELKVDDIDIILLKASSIIASYKYNICIVLYILKYLPLQEVFNMYFNSDNKGFDLLCEHHFGVEKWLSFKSTANKLGANNLGFENCRQLLDILSNKG